MLAHVASPLVSEAVRRRTGGNRTQFPVGRNSARRGQATRPVCGTRAPHFAPQAKNVIFLFMAGAPSHWRCLTTNRNWNNFDGTLPPAELIKDYRAAFIDPNSTLLGPRFKFAKHGKCGAEMSELLPKMAEVADEITIVKSMVTDAFNHAPAQILMSTGSQQFGKPSMGAWTLYGLGSEARRFARLRCVQHRNERARAAAMRIGEAASCPRSTKAFRSASTGDPVLYLSNPEGVDSRFAAPIVGRYQPVESSYISKRSAIRKLQTRINSFEMAYRMQSSAPELMDLAAEPQHVLEMYGAEPGQTFLRQHVPAGTATGRARRALCRDFPRSLGPTRESRERPAEKLPGYRTSLRGMVKDLKQRGLLDETLIVWGGEFGRTPMVQGGGRDGRDHHPNAFTMWLAGGGTRAGITLGESDDFGFNVIRDRVHVRDLHATILHLLGFDHTR